MTYVVLKGPINKWGARKFHIWRFLNPQSYRRWLLFSNRSSLGSVASEMLSSRLGKDIPTRRSHMMLLSIFLMICFPTSLRSTELPRQSRSSPNEALNAAVSSYHVFKRSMLMYIRCLSSHNLSFLELPLCTCRLYFIHQYGS